MLFNIFINNLIDWAECILSKFTANTKLEGMANTPEGCADIQRDLDSLAQWTAWNLMKSKKRKCKALHLGRNNSRHPYIMGTKQVESRE